MQDIIYYIRSHILSFPNRNIFCSCPLISRQGLYLKLDICPSLPLILRYIYCLVFQGASSDRFRWRFAVRGRVVGKIYSLVLPNGDCPLRRRRKRTDKKSQRSLNNDDMLDEWYNIFRKSSVCSPEEEQSPVKVPEYYCLYLVA